MVCNAVIQGKEAVCRMEDSIRRALHFIGFQGWHVDIIYDSVSAISKNKSNVGSRTNTQLILIKGKRDPDVRRDLR